MLFTFHIFKRKIQIVSNSVKGHQIEWQPLVEIVGYTVKNGGNF